MAARMASSGNVRQYASDDDQKVERVGIIELSSAELATHKNQIFLASMKGFELFS